MDDRIDIASATGVDLHLNIAGPGARSYAFVIDWHIRLLLALAWMASLSLLLLGRFSLFDGEELTANAATLWIIAPAMAVYFLYHPVLEILMQGSTPGKRMAGVRVVTTDGQIPGVMAHVIRNVLRLLDSLPTAYAVGLTCTVLTRNSVRIGDLAAGTLLAYETDSRGVNNGHAPAGGAAAGHLGLVEAELLQDLLERWNELGDIKRYALARRLLQQLAPTATPRGDAAGLKEQLEELLAKGTAS